MSKNNDYVTLTKVAKASGVSVSTASRVLNRNDMTIPISQATKEKVLKVAREMGYLPSVAARALRGGATRALGVLGTSPRFFLSDYDPRAEHALFVRDILRGLFDAAIARGYNLTFLTGAEAKARTEMDVLSGLGMVDGMLVLNRDLQADPLFAYALKLYMRPKVYALDYQEDDTAPVSAPDDVAGGEMAVTPLIHRGHAKIAFVCYPKFENIFQRRRAGWARGLEKAGFNSQTMPVFRDIFSVAPDAIRMSGATAAVCANIICAAEFLRQCDLAGVRVPQDMEVVTFSHDTGEPAGDALFAAVIEPLVEIVSRGVHMLVDQLEHGPGATVPTRKLFPYVFRHGGTCPEKR